MDPHVEVVLIALACSGAAGAVGAVLVRRWPRPTVARLLGAVAVVTVASVVAGVAGTARAMYLSEHDLGVATTVSLVAGLVGVAVALTLGRRVVREVQALTAAGVAPPRIVELAAVADHLARARCDAEAAAAKERATDRSRRELVAWVSHDLRTPLAGLRALVEALEDGVLDDPGRHHRQIRHEVDRLSRMVDDLFELSRIQSGTLSLDYEDIDLGDLANDVLTSARPLASARGVQLMAALGPVTAQVDAHGVGRALTNLVVNAIRHTDGPGPVTVHGAADGAEAVLAVSDGCGGIPVEDLCRVFEPGWRGTSSRTPARLTTGELHTGAGLGLAIARGIVEAHQGRVAVANVPGGCRFEIRVPLVRPAA